MSPQKKPRADSKLKTLPPDRQSTIAEFARSHTLTETRTWLAADGLITSEAALSSFLSFWSLQKQLQRNESTIAQLLEDLQSTDPSMSQEQLERAGQMFFSALAIEQQDSLTWKRIQDAKLKLGALGLAQQKFQRDTCELFLKWHEDKQAQEVLRGNVSHTEKIEQLGKLMFGEDWKQ